MEKRSIWQEVEAVIYKEVDHRRGVIRDRINSLRVSPPNRIEEKNFYGLQSKGEEPDRYYTRD